MVQKIILTAGVSGILLMSGSIFGNVSIATALNSCLIVLGGSLVSVFLAYPARTFRELIKSLYVMAKFGEPDGRVLIESIERLARIRRIHGAKALEKEENSLSNRFLRKGIQMIVDGYDRYTIQNAMEKECDLYLSRRESQHGILNTMVKISPVFGFIGTIIGLTGVLNHMGNPEEIGRGMAIALMTTLYGLLFANMVFLPFARKFSEHTRSEALLLNVILEGVMNICDGKNSLYISHSLESFMDMEGMLDANAGRTEGKDFMRRAVSFISGLITGKQNV